MALDQWHNNFNETPQWLIEFDNINDQWLESFPGDIFAKFKFTARAISFFRKSPLINFYFTGKDIAWYITGEKHKFQKESKKNFFQKKF